MHAPRLCSWTIILWAWLSAFPLAGVNIALAESSPHGFLENTRFWKQLILQAEELDLPTQFLTQIPPGFITIRFEDLRTYAAEYHPEQHRMVLNRSLSFNAAGSTLRQLSQLSHRDLATLYHELFHAYLDFLTSPPAESEIDPEGRRLLMFARQQQACRYQHVMITPVRQRKSLTEGRVLTDSEAWEALNETWAVFVEWATWTRLELRGRRASDVTDATLLGEWLGRLRAVDQEGSLVGFYEPEEPRERAMTHKRYLAPSHRITQAEVAILLEVIFSESPALARRSAAVMGGPGDTENKGPGLCSGE